MDYKESSYHSVVYGNYDKIRAKSFNEKLIDQLFQKESNKNLRVLEIGCGTGEILSILQERFNAEGIDHEIDLEKDTLPYFENTFNVVFTKSTIEHVQNTPHLLAEIKRVLKPGGWICILTPAWEFNYKDFYNDPTHVKPFHRKGLQDALRMADFGVVYVDYFYYLPWLWYKKLGTKWWLLPIVKLLSLFSAFKWKNREENIHRPNIRFAQEIQLIGLGMK